LPKDGFSNIIVHNIATGVLKEFDDQVKTKFPGGRNEAIRHLMLVFIRENREKKEESHGETQ
jgi:metal-responsive CopG/Arc/MetJ family transcriptional regulator